MSCEAVLGPTPVAQLQRDPACRSAFAARRVLQQLKCVTHQPMGVKLMQQRHRGDGARVAAVKSQLHDRVVDELVLDFVVRDEHLQRVLMLYWTGAPERVKPVKPRSPAGVRSPARRPSAAAPPCRSTRCRRWPAGPLR